MANNGSSVINSSIGYNIINNGDGKNDSRTKTINYENNISLFPNPTSNFSVLKLNLSKASIIYANVLDLKGNQIMEILDRKLFSSGEGYLEINSSNLANGVYIVKTNIDDKIFYEKLIILHD
jgi:hypothetical protein